MPQILSLLNYSTDVLGYDIVSQCPSYAVFVYCSNEPLNVVKRNAFWWACHGKDVHDVDGRLLCDAEMRTVVRGDIEKVKQILTEVKPEQIQELLQWKFLNKMTALDLCLYNRDIECMKTIIEHAINIGSEDLKALAVVFPYAVIANPSSMVSDILTAFPDESNILLHALMHKSKQVTNTLSKCDDCFYEGVLKDILNHTKTTEDDKPSQRQVMQLQLYLSFASERNNLGLSSFHNEELIPFHLEVLDKCMDYFTRNHENEALTSIYSAFDLIHHGIPYTKATSCHPL